MPYLNKDKKISQDVFYVTDTPFTGIVTFQCYKFKHNGDDSTLALSKKSLKQHFKKGVNSFKIDFSKGDSGYVLPKFYQILKRTDNIPAGQYKTYLTVKDGNKVYHQTYLHQIDSLLGANSSVRKDVNKSLEPKPRSFLGMQFKKELSTLQSTSAATALSNANNKIGRTARTRGLTPVQYKRGDKSYIDFYYEDWFVGRYEVKSDEKITDHLKQQEGMLANNNLGSLNTNDLDEHPSLFSQFKELEREKKQDEEIRGEISLSTNVSSGQEQYSNVDDNYYTLTGRIELPVFGLPVELEGMYTSQDHDRQIKSSYIRMHYDADKAKSELSGTMGAYTSKYSEAKSKGIGMEQVYQTSIKNLEGQKAALQSQLDQEKTTQLNGTTSAFNPNDLKNTATADVKSKESGTANAIGSADTSKSAQQATADEAKLKGDQAKVTDSLAAKKQRTRDRIQALDKKIDKYKMMLAQFRNTTYFDSVVGYNKIQHMSYNDETTYKQLAKSSSAILPDGKARSFLSGITTMDVGMFPQYQSKLTMAGQNMKGIDFGYDLGLLQAGVTAGKTQFIGADGNLDQYTCYSARVSFKPVKKQKIMLLYYGYTPDKKSFSGNGFLNNTDPMTPSFFNPVSIVSIDYDALITKYVMVSAEAAGSYKSSDRTDVPNSEKTGDNLAYHFNAEGNIPCRTPVTLEASWDKTGLGFENNTLPVSMSGTEQYKLAGKTDLFRSFITLGIEYDYMLQDNFSSNGTSRKWGFDFKTNSKRYPSIAVSYKPFTTFRSYTDTLNIPQRPLLGSVWTSKATYQIKNHGKSVRFSILYNKSTSSMDTTNYGSNMLQASCTYTDKKATASLNGGTMQVTGTDVTTITVPNNTKFAGMSGSYRLTKTFSVSGGQEFDFAPFGFCRYSIFGGFNHQFDRIPLTVVINLRYNTYELTEAQGWTPLYSGNIDLIYRLKTKVSKPNRF